MASELTNLPVSQYDWADALFMGLPDWTRWATRTGNSAYLDKMDALYQWTRDQGATSSRCTGTPSQPGLFDSTRGLWYRDCTFVGAKDANGQPIFWSRGNGWVIAAMAQVVQTLPASDSRRAKYVSMLQTMAAALAPLQGSDGFWRSSLLDSSLFPSPETSGTALITYALAYGIKAGLLEFCDVPADRCEGVEGPVDDGAAAERIRHRLSGCGLGSGCLLHRDEPANRADLDVVRHCQLRRAAVLCGRVLAGRRAGRAAHHQPFDRATCDLHEPADRQRSASGQ